MAFESALASDTRCMAAAWGRAQLLERVGDPGGARLAAQACLSIDMLFTPAHDLIERIDAGDRSGPRVRAAPRGMDERAAQCAVWHPGDVILDRYEIIAELGQGAFGVVHRVHHKDWNRDLAVKSPLPRATGEIPSAALASLQKEAEAWIAMALHPHVVTCHYVAHIGGLPRIFMDLVEGVSLLEAIDSRSLYADNEGLPRVLDVIIQTAWGLHHAHTSNDMALVHQDVKPANIMLGADRIARVTDFGTARAERAVGRGATVVGGSPAYASPEQVAARRNARSATDRVPLRLSPASDVWSLGVTLLHALVGERTPPCNSGDVAPHALRKLASPGSAIASGIMPDELYRTLEDVFASEPAERPSARALADRLAAVFESVTGAPYQRRQPKARTVLAADWSNRAVSMLDLGRTDEAQEAMARAMSLSPGNTLIRYNDALMRWRLGDLTDDQARLAIEPFTTLHGVSPERPDFAEVGRRMTLTGFISAEAGHSNALDLLADAPADDPWFRTSAAHARALLTSPAQFSIPKEIVGAAGLHVVGAAHKSVTHHGMHARIDTPFLQFEAPHEKLHFVEFVDKRDGRRGCLQAPLLRSTGWYFVGSDGFSDLGVSADGTTAVTSALDGALRVFEVRTCALVATLTADEPARAVELSATGKWALALYESGTILLWSIERRRVMRSFYGALGVALTPVDERELRVAAVGQLTHGGLDVALLPGPHAPYYVMPPTVLEDARSLPLDVELLRTVTEGTHRGMRFGDREDQRDHAVVVSLAALEADAAGATRARRLHESIAERVPTASPGDRDDIFEGLVAAAQIHEGRGDWAAVRNAATLMRSLPGLEFHRVPLDRLASSVLHLGRGRCIGHHPLWRVRGHLTEVIAFRKHRRWFLRDSCARRIRPRHRVARGTRSRGASR
ncbi:MAG: protein kinase [Polyangiaceae bacterium]|nr:protein kinase [Polyangiaceae bacterium]